MKVPPFIIKKYYLHWYETQSKTTRAYAQSGQYRTIVKSSVQLTDGRELLNRGTLSTYAFQFFFFLLL